ncbi:exo-alpha-sialidase [Planctomyces sp. SH-PL62]|uniref:exo-alpha-sialidase n=1 Tax=Planctomyces sp. SH-PL62 TaxID=1636152 RepID=UPI00078E8E73|nr:exo-alpha-sialidase [Planctomyces sp. SH-PL62]AMV36809.1 Sialidase B precursor [Planctomyces sp. SH-PL62]
MARKTFWLATALLLTLQRPLTADPAEVLKLDDATRDRCLAILREGLASDDFWPAMHAAEALSLDGRGSEVRAALAPRLPAETDARRRCGLARELVRAGDLSQARVLLEILTSPDPYGHAHACESLFKVGEIGDGVALRRALETADPSSVSLMAAGALARWGNPKAFAHLRAALKHDDENLARTAAWILARVGDSRDVPAIQAVRGRFQEPLTRAYFDHALAALGDPEGRMALVGNLTHADPKVQVYAAEFAPDARVFEAKEALVKLLADPTLDVRIRAAQALSSLARPIPADADGEFAVDVFPADATHPRYSEGSVVVLRDGRLLYATTEFDGSTSDFAKARIVAVESADEGRTWGAKRIVQENVGRTNVMSATLRRLLPGAVHDGPIGFLYLQKNSFTDLHAFLRVSDDEGATFGEPIQTTTVPGYHVVNNDRVTVLSTGRLVVPAASTADVDKGGHFVSTCFLSDDGGKTWRRSGSTVDYAKRGAMEPEVLELRDGRLLMHIRTQLGHIAFSESADGGETWSEAKSWGVAAPEAPSTLRRIPSTGDLLLVWNDSVREGQDHGGRRTPLSAAVSADEGKTWSRPIAIEPSDKETYAYTSLEFHRGRALLTYYIGPDSWERLSSRFRSIPIGRFYEPAAR